MNRHSQEAERLRREYESRDQGALKDFYSFSHAGNRFLFEKRNHEVQNILKAHAAFDMKGKKILEVGCGRGDWFKLFEEWGAQEKLLAGIELEISRFEEAKKRFPEADLRLGEASTLPWQARTFDIVLQSTLFTSLLDLDYKKSVAAEMRRVLKPEGLILWYDFFYDNPKNSHVKGIGRTEIETLFPKCHVALRRITLAPPLARWLAPKSWNACLLLEKMKIFNTHYAAVIRPKV